MVEESLVRSWCVCAACCEDRGVGALAYGPSPAKQQGPLRLVLCAVLCECLCLLFVPELLQTE